MNLRPFELALVVIFGLMFLGAIVLLTASDGPSSGGSGEGAVVGDVTIWGTVPPEGINRLITELRKQNESYQRVRYEYFPADEFDQQILEALADREGPDLIFASHEKLVEMRRRIQPMSYETFPRVDVRDKFVDGAQIFAMSDGMYAYPIMVDPLVMFWNRDIVTNEGFYGAPTTWEEFTNQMFPQLIERDSSRTIQRPVIAMGEYGNVRNAYGIISTLLIQGGSEGVVEDDSGDYVINLQRSSINQNPLASAADFYTRFSKPSNTLYSWNRSFPEDRSEFTAGDVVFYLGYGSEGPVMEEINPNLNFDIAEVPQPGTADVRRTYGKFYGLSMLQASQNKAGASAVMSDWGNGDFAARLAEASNMAPVRGATLSQGSDDTYGRVTYQAAGVARGWLNPDKERTDTVFSTMTRDLNENRRDSSQAARDAEERIKDAY